MENKRGLSKVVIVSVIFIISSVSLLIIGAFYLQNSKPQVIEQETFDGGSVILTYADDENLFVIENGVPTTDLVGMTYDSADKYFDFTVKTIVDEADFIEYKIVLIKKEAISTALDDNVKVYLEKEDRGTYTKVSEPLVFESNINDKSLGESAMSIFKIKKNSSGNDNYRLRMWISDEAIVSPEQIQNYGVKIAIVGEAK